MNKYHSIIRYGHTKTSGLFSPGDSIVIQEKVDGSNASFRLIDKCLHLFSRNEEVKEGSGSLKGFYQWATQNIVTDHLKDNYIYFGEWVNKRKVIYAEEFKSTFFLFDIYDTETEEYLEWEVVKSEAERLGLQLVPLFYEGEYVSYEHLESFVGKTMLGGKLGNNETGEGIVVKNVNYRQRNGNQLFVKLVTTNFAEVQKQKAPRDPNKPLTVEQAWVSVNLTAARVGKMLFKLTDQGLLPRKLEIENMKTILRTLTPLVIEDMLEEESEYLPEEYQEHELKRSIGKQLPVIIKGIIAEQGRANTYEL